MNGDGSARAGGLACKFASILLISGACAVNVLHNCITAVRVWLAVLLVGLHPCKWQFVQCPPLPQWCWARSWRGLALQRPQSYSASGQVNWGLLSPHEVACAWHMKETLYDA